MSADTQGGAARTTLRRRLHRLVLACILPLLVVVCVVLLLCAGYTYRYNGLLHNVTAASEFNRGFKENIDLAMYYYVVDSRYSTGLPIEEVRKAQSLAAGLLATTTDKDSSKAIQSVANLTQNLEEKIYEIEASESYDARLNQLEDDIYILTDLIQEYMYNYLYYEAVQLSTLQAEMGRQYGRDVAILALALAVLLAWLVAQARRITRSVVEPVDALTHRVAQIGSGYLNAQAPPSTDLQELQVLGVGLEQMVDRLNALMERNKAEQATLRKTELALLQSQINPHFLYNTLDTIIWLIETDHTAEAEAMVTSLSSFFRTSLSNGRDIIPLSEEKSHTQSYLEIQQSRYRDILSYEIDLPAALDACRVPKLTLQPLVENSLYHGIKLKRGQGHIKVMGWAEGADLVLRVQDDGIGMTAARLAEVQSALEGGAHTGFGLAAVHERIRLLYGAPYGLQIESGAGGTAVTVRLPRQEQQDAVQGAQP